MMLPKFETPDPSINWLRSENERLKQQADKMMETTQIMDVFARYGKFLGVGGSYKYDLMVYPDLDILFTANKADKEAYLSLMEDLASQSCVRSVNGVDDVNFPSRSGTKPKGYWIGVEIPFENDRWGIDCWVQRPEWVNNTDAIYESKLNKLGQDSRDAILNLKYQLIFRGLYGSKYYSNQVYDAVLARGPISIDKFLNTQIIS